MAQVLIFGSQKYAVRVQVDPRALAARGIGIDEVEQAIARGNVKMPTGTLSGHNQADTIQSNGQLTDAAAYRPSFQQRDQSLHRARDGAGRRPGRCGSPALRRPTGVQLHGLRRSGGRPRADVGRAYLEPGRYAVYVVPGLSGIEGAPEGEEPSPMQPIPPSALVVIEIDE